LYKALQKILKEGTKWKILAFTFLVDIDYTITFMYDKQRRRYE